MSFLHQLKSQASALQREQGQQAQQLDENIARCEAACRIVQHYLDDLARQLSVIGPPGPKFTLDGKVPWPAMKLTAFRADARRKTFQGRDVADYLAIGWDVVPQIGGPVGGVVSVNFPPDLQRVESRLAIGQVQHERKEVREPQKNALQAIRFEYLTRTRGNVTVTPDHAQGVLAFRMVNVTGFGVETTQVPAQQVQTGLMDELAKLIVSQPSTFRV